MANQNKRTSNLRVLMKLTTSENEYSKEIKFPRSLTGNNRNILDNYYFGSCNDFRKLSVPLARIELPQTKMLWSGSQTTTQTK